MALVELKNVSFAYKSGTMAPVLRDVDLSIAAGEMVAIRGSSGSGKSTLLHILGCLLRADSGVVAINGRNVAELTQDELVLLRNRELGFVFQQFELIPRASVLDNILLPASYPCEFTVERKHVRARALALAERLKLTHVLHHHPNQLSGGQQQRVAIARALLNEPRLLLADEPTGNLDSANAHEILSILRELNAQGHTVVIITHEQLVADACKRVIEIKDGRISAAAGVNEPPLHQVQLVPKQQPDRTTPLGFLAALLPFAFFNLQRNKARSVLTMLGVTIGIAAVLAMTSLGQFTKRSIMKGYEVMGVNRIVFHGYPNWRPSVKDFTHATFREFDLEYDVEVLRKLFPEIRLLSPMLYQHEKKARFGGKEMPGIGVVGANPEYLAIAGRELIAGATFSELHVERRSAVCMIGHGVATRLFTHTSPLGQMLTINDSESSLSCRVIGVLQSQKSNIEWFKPDQQIILPFSVIRSVGNVWERRIYTIMAQVSDFAKLEDLGLKMKKFYTDKYGTSGEFMVNQDDVMVAQIKRFLNIFAILLAGIAMISLLVGGIGIMNMMLVSVAERYREIGLRKAFGASNRAIRMQFLLEAVALCIVAGVIGLLLGFVVYEGAIYAAAKLTNKVEFEWVFEPVAMVVAFAGIVVVGVLSGILPAIKAEKLEVVEALRSE